MFDSVRAIHETFVDHTEGEVGFGVAGIFFEGGCEVADAFGEIRFADGDEAEVIEGVGVGGIHGDSSFEEAARFGEVEGIFAHEAGASGERSIIGCGDGGSLEGALTLFFFGAAAFFFGAAALFFFLLTTEALGILLLIFFAQSVAMGEDLFKLGVIFAEFEEAVEVFDGEVEVLEVFFVNFGDIAVIAGTLRVGFEGEAVVFEGFFGEVIHEGDAGFGLVVIGLGDALGGAGRSVGCCCSCGSSGR